ncbi:MAG TPA: hypothetical protein PKD55_21875 [Bellilinea sp.]|nr:hypothetical protein [Bellilinea sp.]
MVAVGGSGEAPAVSWLEPMLTHQPPDLLTADENTPLAERGTNAPVTAAFERVADRGHAGDAFGIIDPLGGAS